MAERRMFHTAVVESDSFLDLPPGAQALYFHLGMHADDDGFINGPKQIARKLRRPPKELRLLEENGFVLNFDGILVIKHWLIANSLRPDRIRPTPYPQVAEKLFITNNKIYTTAPQPTGSLLDRQTQILSDKCQRKVSKEKISKDKLSKDKLSKDKAADAADDFAAEPQTYDDNNKYFESNLSLEERIEIARCIPFDKYTEYTQRLQQMYEQAALPEGSHYTIIMQWWNEDRRK